MYLAYRLVLWVSSIIQNQTRASKSHVEARLKYGNFKNQKTNVGTKLVEVSKEDEKGYAIHLTSYLEVARFFLRKGILSVGMTKLLIPLTRVHTRDG
jgi:hypothetical protein